MCVCVCVFAYIVVCIVGVAGPVNEVDTVMFCRKAVKQGGRTQTTNTHGRNRKDGRIDHDKRGKLTSRKHQKTRQHSRKREKKTKETARRIRTRV